MNLEQENYIAQVDKAAPDEIFVKHTGREGISLPFHRHARHQLVYTLSGTLHIQVGNRNCFVPEKHLALVPAGVEHRLSSNNRQIALVLFYYGDEADASDDSAARSLFISGVDAFVAENLRFIASAGGVIDRRSRPDLFLFATGFFRLLPSVIRHREMPLQSLVVPSDSRLRPVLQYMGDHLGDDLTLERVAGEFGFSARNLSRLFHNEHLRFSSYLNHRRITRAIELFAAHDRTLQEIAYEVGSSSPANFTRMFRQLLGVSPRTFFAGAAGE